MKKDLALTDPQLSKMVERIKMMISGGEKLTDDEALAHAQFAITEGLDPFTEVHTLKGKGGKSLGPCVAHEGLKRKAMEQMGNGSYFIDYIIEDIPNEKVLLKIKAVLRDTKTMKEYLDMRIEATQMFRDCGSEDPGGDAIEIVGPPPTWEGLGYFWKSELNEYKDKGYNPHERCKKRVASAALRKRFSLNYKRVSDNGEGDQADEVDYIEGEVVVEPQEIYESKALTREEVVEEPERTEAEMISQLGFDAD